MQRFIKLLTIFTVVLFVFTAAGCSYGNGPSQETATAAVDESPRPVNPSPIRNKLESIQSRMDTIIADSYYFAKVAYGDSDHASACEVVSQLAEDLYRCGDSIIDQTVSYLESVDDAENSIYETAMNRSIPELIESVRNLANNEKARLEEQKDDFIEVLVFEFTTGNAINDAIVEFEAERAFDYVEFAVEIASVIGLKDETIIETLDGVELYYN
ncbi:MAG: hypothetical protein K6G89_00435 [Clostridia bacterium]|nr:hypothetical protein [Clostridia bacterium]